MAIIQPAREIAPKNRVGGPNKKAKIFSILLIWDWFAFSQNVAIASKNLSSVAAAFGVFEMPRCVHIKVNDWYDRVGREDPRIKIGVQSIVKFWPLAFAKAPRPIFG